MPLLSDPLDDSRPDAFYVISSTNTTLGTECVNLKLPVISKI
jgi:hypothetical protein